MNNTRPDISPGSDAASTEVITPSAALLEVRGLKVHFARKKRYPWHTPEVVHAVDGIDLDVAPGKALGLVGESGSGKTTVALAIMRLVEATAGFIRLNGADITRLSGDSLRAVRRNVQMIFQDPYSSLNPRMRVGALVEEPMLLMSDLSAAERSARVRELFAQVGLREDQTALFPHQFSGGQRQRIGIARALAIRPSLVVCDEPVSALDVAIQAQTLNLLARLQKEYGLAYLFISHDLGVVQRLCDDVAVMYMGQIVEQASSKRLFGNPMHPYTWALFSAVPRKSRHAAFGKRAVVLEGDPPSPLNPPAGCRFANRCPYVEPRCREHTPELRSVASGHRVACHLVTADGLAPHRPVNLLA